MHDSCLENMHVSPRVSSRVFPSLFPAHSWLIPGFFLAYSWLISNLSLAYSWLIPNLFLTHSKVIPLQAYLYLDFRAVK